MNALTIATLAAALAIAAPALAETNAPGPGSPPDIVLRCRELKAGTMDLRSSTPETVMIWSAAGVMSWPRGGRDSRFPAQVRHGTIFYDEPMIGGHRAGHIDRYTGDYEELVSPDEKPGEAFMSRGKCVVSAKQRKF